MLLPAVAIYIGARQASRDAHRATHDSLTGLPNRLALQERLGTALTAARRDGEPVALLLVDLDDFKAVNDTLGHAYGDGLLQAVCERLQGEVAEDDLLARLGGDEFALLPAAGSPEAAHAVAERLTRVLERPFALDGVMLDVRASVGIACHPEDGDTAEELMQHADVALYCAKASGIASVERYDPEQDDHSVDRLVLAGQLRRGLERGEIVLEYQPKYALEGGRPEAVEALARWNHPALGRIGPDGFIPLAEHTGLISALTRVVMASALAQVRTWRDQGVELRVAVNISPRNLLDRDLPRRIAELLDEHGLDPAVLQLEVTESRAVPNRATAMAVLEDLRTMGVGIAIDDFGTGFSSLVQLQHLRVDEIKIDRSFVMRLTRSANDETIVRSTIDLARNLGLRVTAEGVETAEAHRRLAEMGCDLAQGYHLCPPLPGPQCAEAVLAVAPKLRSVTRTDVA
jgi:diguanylate cyclase (GGDEF)-like protein